MEINSKIYVAGHHGMVGSAIVRKLKHEGCEIIVTRTHRELDLVRETLIVVIQRKNATNKHNNISKIMSLS